MLKKFAGWLIALAFVTPSFLGAVTNDPTKPPVFSVGNPNYTSGAETGTFTVDAKGNLLPGKNLTQDVGESTHAYKTGYFGQISVASGIVNERINFGILDSSNAAAYGQFTVSTTALVASGTTYATWDMTQSTNSRNVVLVSSFVAGASTTTVIATATVVGTDAKGNPVTETIFFSTTQTAGNIAFSNVSSVTIVSSSVSLTGEANVVFKIGTGNKFGIGNDISTSSDAYKISTSSGVIRLTDPGVSVDTTFDTIDFGQNIPNSVRNFWAWFKIRKSVP